MLISLTYLLNEHTSNFIPLPISIITILTESSINIYGFVVGMGKKDKSLAFVIYPYNTSKKIDNLGKWQGLNEKVFQ